MLNPSNTLPSGSPNCGPKASVRRASARRQPARSVRPTNTPNSSCTGLVRETKLSRSSDPEREDVDIPETDLEGLSYLGGAGLGELLDAEFEATEASLAVEDIPNIRIEVDAVDAHGIGELLYALEAATVIYGELAGVSTFTQPAVEWGKKAARGLLGGGEFAEAEAVADKREFTIE